ncbi:hypothetical protein COU61_01315 [Candidatus Pacearchaeota archaeon CG10_big_fil_rev_8_21_14_0_10_35_13]|nr:MAG: hypothetical protein COU61_01315 [Candidatus Pacearchaeota archaeon CG10_big_fil_rev_8_21_14_0_10_35_13]
MVIVSDLHTHTVYSDGLWTPDRLFREAKKLGIKQISITDHNNLEAVNESRITATKLGLQYVTGIEIDVKTVFDGEWFHNHLLGYGFDENKLMPFVKEVNDLNKEYFQELVDNLVGYLNHKDFVFNEPLIKMKKEINPGWISPEAVISDEYRRKYSRELTKEQLSKILREKFLGPEIICRFIKNNLVENPSAITDAYPTTWKKIFLENFKELFEVSGNYYKSHLEAINAIKMSGGFAVIAHPFLDELFWDQNKKVEYLRFIDYLTVNGLSGLEAYYYSNDRYTKEQEDGFNKITKALCKDNSLIQTYGSDCHGRKRYLGKFGSENIILF